MGLLKKRLKSSMPAIHKQLWVALIFCSLKMG